jgi:hypothetical protein
MKSCDEYGAPESIVNSTAVSPVKKVKEKNKREQRFKGLMAKIRF